MLSRFLLWKVDMVFSEFGWFIIRVSHPYLKTLLVLYPSILILLVFFSLRKKYSCGFNIFESDYLRLHKGPKSQKEDVKFSALHWFRERYHSPRCEREAKKTAVFPCVIKSQNFGLGAPILYPWVTDNFMTGQAIRMFKCDT